MKAAFGTKSRLTPAIHQHDLQPLAVPAERTGSWVFPAEIIGSSAWLSSLWERRARLSSMKVTLAWGMKDIAFRERELKRWAAQFPQARVRRFDDVGHDVSEEVPAELAAEVVRLTAE